MFPTNILQKELYYSGFIFSCYAFVFISWQNQACKLYWFRFHAFFVYPSVQGCQSDRKTKIDMIEHSKLIAVHDSMKDFLKKKDFSHPYIIYATNLDREEGIDYVIDTLMGNRNGRYQMVKDMTELSHEIAKIESFPKELQFENRYLVKKIYFKNELENAKNEVIEILSEPLHSRFPIFVILSPQTSAVEVDFNKLSFEFHQY